MKLIVAVTHGVGEVAVSERCSLAACILGSAPPVASPPALDPSLHRNKPAFQFGILQDSVATEMGQNLQSTSNRSRSHAHKTGSDVIAPPRRS